MAGRLRSTVYLNGEDGTTTCLLAGSEPTAAEAALITNPKAWEGGEAPAAEQTLADSWKAEQVRADGVREPAGPIPQPPPPDGFSRPANGAPIPAAPPRKGPGSSKAAWAAYAAARGLDVPEGADRDGIILEVDLADRRVDD